jgi:hypothetical protein
MENTTVETEHEIDLSISMKDRQIFAPFVVIFKAFGKRKWNVPCLPPIKAI